MCRTMLLGFMLCSSPLIVLAQAAGSTGSSSFTTADLPTPKPVTATAVRKDPAALAEVTSFEEVAEAAAPGVQTFTGTVTIGRPELARTYEASMLIGQNGRFRLDVHAMKEESLRIKGVQAARRVANEAAHTLPESLFGAPFLLPDVLSSLATDPKVSLVDGGIAIVGERHLHKITISRRLVRATTTFECADLYFEESSHLLNLTVLMTAPEQRSAPAFKKVISYEDYSLESDKQVAHRFVESDNGAPTLTFISHSVSLMPATDDSQFIF